MNKKFRTKAWTPLRVCYLLLIWACVVTSSMAQTFSTFQAPDANNIRDMTVGPDGNVWYVVLHVFQRNVIRRITPQGVITAFELPIKNTCGFDYCATHAQGITSGPDGNIWVTLDGYNSIVRMTTSGSPTVFSSGITPSAGLGGIAAGPDGNLWFTETNANKIGRITPQGVVTEFLIPTPASNPLFITGGSDGNVWFVENSTNKIAQITPAGVITEFPVPTPDSRPFDIAKGSDGDLWFTERSKIGRISPTGVITEYNVPAGGAGGSASTSHIAAATDKLWFTKSYGPEIGSVTGDGSVSLVSFPGGGGGSNLGPIAVDANGSVWFASTALGGIVRMNPSPQGDANGDGGVNVSDVIYIISALFGNGPQPQSSADVDGDGQVTVKDIFFLINYIYHAGPPPE